MEGRNLLCFGMERDTRVYVGKRVVGVSAAWLLKVTAGMCSSKVTAGFVWNKTERVKYQRLLSKVIDNRLSMIESVASIVFVL